MLLRIFFAYVVMSSRKSKYKRMDDARFAQTLVNLTSHLSESRSPSAANKSPSLTTPLKPNQNKGFSHQNSPREYSPLVASGERTAYGAKSILVFSVASEMSTTSLKARMEDATPFSARFSPPRDHRVRSCAASNGSVRRR